MQQKMSSYLRHHSLYVPFWGTAHHPPRNAFSGLSLGEKSRSEQFSRNTKCGHPEQFQSGAPPPLLLPAGLHTGGRLS